MMKNISILLILASFWVFAFTPSPEKNADTQADSYVYLPIVIKAMPLRVNAVANGNFEAGRTAWTEVEDNIFNDYPLIVMENQIPPLIDPYDGIWVSWLGGDSGMTSYIEQTITVPAVRPELEYYQWIDSNFACDGSFGRISIGGTTMDEYGLCSATDTGGWVKRTINLSTFAGQTVILRFLSQTGATNYSSLYIDAVSVHTAP